LEAIPEIKPFLVFPDEKYLPATNYDNIRSMLKTIVKSK
jgi:hypothetical protein